MRFLKVIIVLLTISFSAFLINRSCHDITRVDPDSSGGISQMMRERVRESVTMSPSPAPSTELSSIELGGEKHEEVARIDSMPLTGIQQGHSKGSTSTAAMEEAARKLHGTWVLTDGNTTLQLTVVNHSGVLKGKISEAGKSIRIEQEAFLLGDDNSVFVYGLEPITDDPSGYGRIVLAFYFKEDGSTQVIWMRRDKSIRLHVVSYVK